ncbi:MAG: hypothetical protein ABIK89_05110 [Planctomycetota bacterium]
MHRVRCTQAIQMSAALAVGLAVVFAAGVSAADDVWLVNTRQAPRSNPVGGEDRIQYSRLENDNDWVAADLAALLATDDPAVPTCVFVHGNRSGLSDAIRMGMGVDRELKLQAGERPFRFVIWAWPADQVRGTRQDMQLKACRSDVQSYYLAQWLGQVNPDVSVGLVGYSFGARAITGALHLAAGGRLAGRTLPEGTTVPERPIRVVLVAAATNSDWLLPGRANGLALGRVERLLVTRNSCDPALKWYPLMYGMGGPQAMGFAGPACVSRLGDERERVEVVGLECSVGRNHDFSRYRRASGLRGRLGWYAFLEPSEPAEQALTAR